MPKARILVRPLESVFRGSYFSSTRVKRSRTLPWPPVILAIMSLPQSTAQSITPIRTSTTRRRMEVMILRALPGFFLSFFMRLLSLVVAVSDLTGVETFVEAVSSPVSLLKSKA